VKFTKHGSLPQFSYCQTLAFLEASRCHGAVCVERHEKCLQPSSLGALILESIYIMYYGFGWADSSLIRDHKKYVK